MLPVCHESGRWDEAEGACGTVWGIVGGTGHADDNANTDKSRAQASAGSSSRQQAASS